MRKDFKDMTGKIFGNWTVKCLIPDYPKRGAYWKCQCRCGNTRIVSGAELRRGKSTQCKECKEKMPKPHGYSRTDTYYVWQNMRARCYNPKRRDYAWYGKKGISVCQRWNESFENFLQDMGEKPTNRTLDRINNNGNYCKDNCRWATKQEQRDNQSN